jgi:SAM-dependent methyltransferase
VSESRSAARMRAWWESAAQRNAAWYVDTSLSYDDPDMERFWATGELTVSEALDGAPAQPPGTGLAVEIGSGLGRICRALSRRGFREVVGVDISPTMVRRAGELVAEPGVRFLLGDGRGLGQVESSTADLVLSFTVFQHMPDERLVAGYLREAARVLRPGGLLVAQWNGTDGARRWALRRAVLSSLPGRRRRSADPYGREVAEFLGSRVPVPRMRRLLDEAGLELAGLRGEGTLFCWLWARRPTDG